LVVKRLPATIIFLALAASWAGSVQAAPWDPYTPPGGPVASNRQAVGAHPAVVRVIAPERQSTSLGSGVLVGNSERLGLVVTNWHVVQDATGTIMVAFPDGFRSAARLLKTDRHWDLAALAIWRPNVAPVPLAAYMPRPGEPLTIAGYGGGPYRASTGRLVDYAAPENNYPFELLEVSTPARQGDSGGPIFNSHGEVAGVLFGTGGGRTMGSYSGRVRAFLVTVLPDFERLEPDASMVAGQPAPEASPTQPAPQMVAQRPAIQSVPDPLPPVFETMQPVAATPRPNAAVVASIASPAPRTPSMLPVAPNPQAPPATVGRPAPPPLVRRMPPLPATTPASPPAKPVAGPAIDALTENAQPQQATPEEAADSPLLSWTDLAGSTRTEQAKTVLAGLGCLFLLLTTLRLLGEMDDSRSRKAAPVAKPTPRRSRRAA
jgi:hypothetical protein